MPQPLVADPEGGSSTRMDTVHGPVLCIAGPDWSGGPKGPRSAMLPDSALPSPTGLLALTDPLRLRCLLLPAPALTADPDG